MTTAQRLKIAPEMSDSVRNVAIAGLRSRRPDLSEGELSRELLRIMYGFVPRPWHWKKYFCFKAECREPSSEFRLVLLLQGLSSW
jgi:hypothetical protein